MRSRTCTRRNPPYDELILRSTPRDERGGCPGRDPLRLGNKIALGDQKFPNQAASVGEGLEVAEAEAVGYYEEGAEGHGGAG